MNFLIKVICFETRNGKISIIFSKKFNLNRPDGFKYYWYDLNKSHDILWIQILMMKMFKRRFHYIYETNEFGWDLRIYVSKLVKE